MYVDLSTLELCFECRPGAVDDGPPGAIRTMRPRPSARPNRTRITHGRHSH